MLLRRGAIRGSRAVEKRRLSGTRAGLFCPPVEERLVYAGGGVARLLLRDDDVSDVGIERRTCDFRMPRDEVMVGGGEVARCLSGVTIVNFVSLRGKGEGGREPGEAAVTVVMTWNSGGLLEISSAGLESAHIGVLVPSPKPGIWIGV
jgi:hypothetical protein